MAEIVQVNWENYALLGKEKVEENQLEEAIANYEKAIELNCDKPWVYIKLGDVYSNLGKFDLALERVENAIALDENNVWGYVAAAQVLQKAGKIEEALEKCEAGLRVSPGNQNIEGLKAEITTALPEVAASRSIGDTSKRQEKIEIKSRHQTLDNLHSQLALQQEQIEKLTFQIEMINHKQKLLDYPLREVFSVQQLPQSIVIDGGFPLTSEQGFYSAEYDRYGNQYRWTGPEQSFYFDVLIDRSQPKKILLKLIGSSKLENIDTLRFFADEQEIRLQKLEFADEIYELQGILPIREGSSKTKLSFWVQELVKNSELNPDSQDHRLLGVAFSQLIIEPKEEAS